MKIKLKISILIFLMCILSQNSYSQQNNSGWFWANSQPQSNDLNWCKLIDPTHYYAVGENGTFMKSSDGGDTWKINSQAGVTDPSFNSGGTLRLYSAWFFNVNTGYVTGQSVSGDGGIIRRTTDGGESFSDIGLGIPSGLSRVFDITFINATTGFLCGNSSVKAMKTTDAGLTWSELPNMPPVTLSYNSIYTTDGIKIYLAADGDRLVVRTTDAGASWSEDILPGTTYIQMKDIVFQNATTGFAGGNANYFGFTTDGGDSWTQAIFPNTQMGIYDLQMVGSTVYALGSYNSIYYTSNLGLTWDSLVFNDPTNLNQPYLSLVYAFDINGSDAIVVGLNGKVNISNDGGTSWRNKNYSVGNNNYTFASIFALPGTQKVWTAGAGGMVLYSSNRGANWSQQPINLNFGLKDIQMVDADTGYTVGGNASFGEGYTYKTTNGGNNWIFFAVPNQPHYKSSVSFVDANTGWIFGGLPFGSGVTLIKTTNGGANWISQVTTPAFKSTIAEGDMSDANNGWLVSGTFVAKTTNGGTNWIQQPVTPSNSWNSVQTFSNSTVYLGGGQLVNKTTNGGATWTTVSTPSGAGMFHMNWADLYNGTIVGTAGYTAKTSDGGLTWTERNPGSSTITGVSMIGKDTVFASCDRNVWGAIFRLYENIPTVTFNLSVGIEGFWNGTTQVSDTVKCHLRNSTSPYAEVEVSTAVIDNSGFTTFSFNTAPSGSYYLEITQRNSLETWSALPQAIVPGGTYTYNFTTSASQAYGNNMKLTSGRYCNYSGDVTQEGSVDLTDLIQIFNASSSFASGYVVEDVNGDSIVDLTDLVITANNVTAFVVKQTP